MITNQVTAIVVAFGFIILLIIVLSAFYSEENFTVEMRRERANRAYDILNPHKTMPSYHQFKKLMPDSDAVEYTDLSKLKNKGRFTMDNIVQVFGL